MSFHYGQLAQKVVETLMKENQLHRILSLDLETKVLSPENFLTGESLLAVSLAYQDGGKIHTRVLMAERDDAESERKMLSELDSFLRDLRPLVIVGYNNTGYDLPLLTLKVRRSPVPFWAVKDMLSRSFPLDMMHVVKFEIASYDRSVPTVMSLEKVLRHPRFANLPLSNGKELINVEGVDKGQVIYDLWKNQRGIFEKYSESDAKDVLTIFNHLFIDKPIVAAAG